MSSDGSGEAEGCEGVNAVNQRGIGGYGGFVLFIGLRLLCSVRRLGVVGKQRRDDLTGTSCSLRLFIAPVVLGRKCA